MLSHRQDLKWKMHIVKDDLVSTANIYPRFYNWDWWTNFFYIHLYRHSFLEREVLHPVIKLVDKYNFYSVKTSDLLNIGLHTVPV